MDGEIFLKAWSINELIKRGYSQSKAFDIIGKKYFKLSYCTGSIDISQTIMVDKENNFYGVDDIGRLVLGSFIDERYIAFYIVNSDNTVTRYIGYNNTDFITLQRVDSKVYMGMKIAEIDTIDEDMSIRKEYDKINNLIVNMKPNDLLELLKAISEYQEYIDGQRVIATQLGINEGKVEEIKELKKC